MIDSHAHLADPAFDPDRDDVIARAREAGLEGVVCIGESLAAADGARALASRHPGFLWFTAGVHPHDAAGFDLSSDIPAIRAMAARGAVAVGECGLDYHYDHSPRERQREAFTAQLDLARELQLPVVVHSRDAEADTMTLVAEAGRGGVQGVLHCFTGSHALARTGLDAGWMISFAGIVTFRKWEDVELLRLVPDDRLLVETDAPYLAPVPHRGKRNEPTFVQHTLARLAAARGVEPAQLAARTADNARRLFNLRAPG